MILFSSARKITIHTILIHSINFQVYKGLHIVTAKVTKEEQAKAAHHMLDIVDPLNPSYTVVQFRDAAIPIVISPFFHFYVFSNAFSTLNKNIYTQK